MLDGGTVKNEPIFGLVVAGLLGILDGLTSWFTPAVCAELLTIVIGSAFYYFAIMLPGSLVGAIAGYATQKHSEPLTKSA